MNEIKDIEEILELAKEEIENNRYVTATLDLHDLKSLKRLYELYQEEKEKNMKLEKNRKVSQNFAKTVAEDYIAKDKIREKIKKVNESDENYVFNNLTSEDIRRTITTNLQELLEGDE